MSKCVRCDRELCRYFGSWCPKCDKPRATPWLVLNLIASLYHVDAVMDYPPGEFGDRSSGAEQLWELLCEYGYVNNDVVVSIDFVTILDDLETNAMGANAVLSPVGLEYLRAFIQVMEVRKYEALLWKISW